MIVVKVGGAEGIDYEAVAKDAASLWEEGQRLLLVHGGSAETNKVAEALGHPPRFLAHPGGQVSRLTDRRTLEIFTMVYAGLVNKRLVELLQKEGVNALGLSGLDGRLLVGRRKTAVKYVEDGKVKIHRGDYTGTVEEVNKALLDLLLGQGYLPVITPPALSYEGEAINTDGDQIAALLARVYGAEALVYLSNVPGLLAHYPDEASLVREIPVERVEDPEYLALAQGRMKRKVMGAVEAVKGGVKRVIFADARVENPIRRALSGEGTVVR
ncbi:MAG: [LysW]-aminoadipate kinase [Thermus aquaticus]|jgi:acetylglutamate/LysW-gamma-L-alpha-aminoadipate kinase|uniref:[LysW]-aminoadipate kinase n=1 Tax=Thermus aquaticus TaxID=271 RepID=UPI003C01F10F